MKWLLLLLSLCCLSFAHAEDTLRLTLAHGAAIDHPRQLAALRFAELVATSSHGRIMVEVFPAASMGDDATMVNAMRDGTLDMSANSQGALSKVVPEYAVLGMPFLFPSAEAAWKVLDGPAGKLLAEHSAAQGFQVLGFWDNGIRQISNNVRPIVSPADLRGLRIRTPPDPVTVDMIQSLGAQARQIEWADVYNALQQKVVDGQENPLVNILDGKLYQVQKYLSLTGHKYEVTPFVMARKRWKTLSPGDKALILAAAREATAYQRSLSQQANKAALDQLIRLGMKVQAVDKAPFIAACRPLYDKWLASPAGPFLRIVMEAAK